MRRAVTINDGRALIQEKALRVLAAGANSFYNRAVRDEISTFWIFHFTPLRRALQTRSVLIHQ